MGDLMSVHAHGASSNINYVTGDPAKVHVGINLITNILIRRKKLKKNKIYYFSHHTNKSRESFFTRLQ